VNVPTGRKFRMLRITLTLAIILLLALSQTQLFAQAFAPATAPLSDVSAQQLQQALDRAREWSEAPGLSLIHIW